LSRKVRSPATERLRIGIDGAQGTGKTSLVAALREHYGGRFEYIPEAARIIGPVFGVHVAADWPALLADKERLEAFFDAEETWVTARERAAGSFIIDSSLWLVAAYRAFFACREGVRAAASQTYDLLLCCGLSSPVVDDGFRFAEGQSEVDARYRRLLGQSFQGTTVFLPSGESRVGVAIDSIDRLVAQRRHGTA
jgi:nicotinamide riboside kinase